MAGQVLEDGPALKADNAVFLNGFPKVSAGNRRVLSLTLLGDFTQCWRTSGSARLGKVCSYVVGVDLRFNLRNSNSRANVMKSVFCILASCTFKDSVLLLSNLLARTLIKEKSGTLLSATTQTVSRGVTRNANGNC